MFSILMHRVYIGVLLSITLALSYQGLVRVYSHPIEAITYGTFALGISIMFTLMVRRWLHLEFIWARAQSLLAPNRAQEEYRSIVKDSLNRVLSKIVFRDAMKNVLDKNGVFKLFVENGRHVVQLDIAFPDTWNNHNYLRSALGWIAACMPSSVMCQTLERKDTRLVFRFVHQDSEKKDAQSLHDALSEWKNNIQSVLVIRLDKCTVQDLNYVPQKIVRTHRLAALPNVPNTAFEEHVLLNEEQVRLHIGFNGSTYYTYFEDGATTQVHGRREYQSWAALWSVWQHMNEVQYAFKAASR
jgi:hypothetical protein